MKKRFIALLLCCVMLFTLSPSLISAASATDINGTTVETPTDEPTAEPTVEEPKTEEPKTEEPKTEEPKTEEPKTEEPKTEEPKTEEPKTEEPKTEEPKTEEPKTEEPKTEEPKAEEPKAEEETTIPAAEQPGAPVESEIITPTVNFTKVAPFLAPVTGTSPQQTMLRTMAYSARANNETPDSGDNGMVINKTATANADGSYTITLEAYATGSKVVSEVKEDVPTDIVLVLDQSGSMAEKMNTYGFQEYTGKSNSDFYALRHNNNGNKGNLYYQLEDGSYVTVSVTRTQGESTYTYRECPSDWKNDRTSSLGDWNPDDYWKYSENLYVKVGEEYQKVTLTRNWDYFGGHYTYTYTFPDNSTFVSEGNNTSPGNFKGKGPLYVRSESQGEYTYTYTYTDKDGVTQTIGTSTGANTQPTDFTLYERYSTGSVTRLQALKTAVTSFTNAVAEKAAGADKTLGTNDDVNHRIAVVGFSSDDYSNTELLTGVNITTGNQNYGTQPVTDDWYGYYYYPTGYAKNGAQYGSITVDQYSKALQNMDTAAGKANVTDAFNALTAHGGTYTNDGMDMANEIFKNTPIDAGEKRNRVVIVFTDGVPGLSGYDSDVASDAIRKGATTKNVYGATVYTVGIFSGADATSAGNSTGTDTQKANWFMQNLSSNNGKVQTPSYYLSAADADSLNSIFQQISDQIETGGSSSTLTADAVVKDIIAPQFTLPAGATTNSITLETYRCTGKDSAGNYTWSKNANAMDATATVNGDTVSVTGFDFAANWVGTETSADGATTYRGHKLVISFTVSPKAGFLGGNNVYTNGSAGIYENVSAQTPVMTFNQPQVNVPIKDVTVTANDKNVYLMGEVTADQLKDGSEISVGDVKLDLSKATDTDKPYGLDPWQTEYVNITVAVKDANGKAVTDLNALTDDTTYTISVTVAPKPPVPTSTEGTIAVEKSGEKKANINVFKPELTFQDSEVYYGDTVPADYSNLTSTVWKHGETLDTTVIMADTAPTLTLGYTPEAGKIADGKINTKRDIAVDVAVEIDGTNVTTDTTFKHTNCAGKTCTLPAGAEFLLHVKTCSLTITKTGGNANEPYVFTVFKDNEKYSEVTVMGGGSETICELPVGTYTIEEDTGWSWRFTPTIGGGVTLSKDKASNTITCTNTKANDYWLNGFSNVEKNIFGVKH